MIIVQSTLSFPNYLVWLRINPLFFSGSIELVWIFSFLLFNLVVNWSVWVVLRAVVFNLPSFLQLKTDSVIITVHCRVWWVRNKLSFSTPIVL